MFPKISSSKTQLINNLTMKGGQYVKKILVDTALALVMSLVDDYVRAETTSFPTSAGTYEL